MALSGSYETDKNILLNLDEEDFRNVCYIDKYTRDLCNNKNIIHERLMEEYGVDYVNKYPLRDIDRFRQYISLTDIIKDSMNNIESKSGYNITPEIIYIITQGRKDVILTFRYVFDEWYGMESKALIYIAMMEKEIDIIELLIKEEKDAKKYVNDPDIIYEMILSEDIRIFNILVKYGMEINEWPAEYYRGVLDTDNYKFIREVNNILSMNQ